MNKTLFILPLALAVSGLASAATLPPAAADATRKVETIVCIRHAEKPHGGLGQLTCRGLNRALALPKVLLGKYDKPKFIFAPNPTEKVDGSPGYYYVRPLMTIEPTAISCGLPVNTHYGYRDIKGLEARLKDSEYENATIFVAWEHGYLDRFAKNMVKDSGGDPAIVPPWSDKEYDLIFVFKYVTENGRKNFSFTVEHEGLNGLNDQYPTIVNAAPPAAPLSPVAAPQNSGSPAKAAPPLPPAVRPLPPG